MSHEIENIVQRLRRITERLEAGNRASYLLEEIDTIKAEGIAVVASSIEQNLNQLSNTLSNVFDVCRNAVDLLRVLQSLKRPQNKTVDVFIVAAYDNADCSFRFDDAINHAFRRHNLEVIDSGQCLHSGRREISATGPREAIDTARGALMAISDKVTVTLEPYPEPSEE